MSTPSSPVDDFLTAYAAAVRAKDVDAFVALYDDDIRVFDLWESWEMCGITAWRSMAAGWFSALGNETVIVDIGNIESTMSGDLAIAHGFLKFTAMSVGGEKLRSLDNRMSIALRKSDAGWKVIHEHTSVPLDQTCKGILQRSE